MEVKIVKKEETSGITFGDKVVKLADICKVSQKDGAADGFTVGLLIGKKDKNGDLAKRVFAPLAEVLRYELGPMMLTPFNAYTKVWKSERKCAEAVKEFTEKYNGLELGARASATLATATEEEKPHAPVKKTDIERVSAFLAGFIHRKNSPLNGEAFVNTLFAALETLPLHPNAENELNAAWTAVMARREAEAEKVRAAKKEGEKATAK